MELFNELLPVLVSGLMAVVGYLVKIIFDLYQRVVALEVKIENLIKFLVDDKKNTKD